MGEVQKEGTPHGGRTKDMLSLNSHSINLEINYRAILLNNEMERRTIS